MVLLLSCNKSDNQIPNPGGNGNSNPNQVKTDLSASADFIELSGKDSTAAIICYATNYSFVIVYSLKRNLSNLSGTPAKVTYTGKKNENFDRVNKNSITGFYTAYLQDADSKVLLQSDKKLFTQEGGNTYSNQFFANDNRYQRIQTDQTTEEGARNLIKIYMSSTEQATRIVSVSDGVEKNKIKIDRINYLFIP